MVINATGSKRINGHSLAQYINSRIILLGQIKKVSTNGKSVEILTTDNVSVNVNLPEPIDTNLEGFIEINGNVLSKSTVSCQTYLYFQSAISKNFDIEKYNTLISTLHVIGDKKWKLSANDDLY